MYILYRGGILRGDVQKLMSHGQLPPLDAEAIYNLDLLGAPRPRSLKDTTPPPQPLFPTKPPAVQSSEEVSLSRFEPVLRSVLEEHIRGTLDASVFPPVKPHLDGPAHENSSSSSLRSASKPTWARNRPTSHEDRQRIIIFMAGGATYSEARACYEVSQTMSKEVYLATSHMITPKLFLRQVGDLSTDRRRLDLPAERPPPKAPAHLFEREPQPVPVQGPRAPNQADFGHPPAGPRPPAPPTAAMGAMNLSASAGHPHQTTNGSSTPMAHLRDDQSGKLRKDKDKDKKKKHLHLFR
jgi:syntaxin-binding protein 1